MGIDPKCGFLPMRYPKWGLIPIPMGYPRWGLIPNPCHSRTLTVVAGQGGHVPVLQPGQQELGAVPEAQDGRRSRDPTALQARRPRIHAAVHQQAAREQRDRAGITGSARSNGAGITGLGRNNRISPGSDQGRITGSAQSREGITGSASSEERE